jgi:hypothetical protein
MLPYSGPSSINGDTLYHKIINVSNTTPIKITADAPHHLSIGATVVIDQVKDPAGRTANGTFRIGNLTRDTFDLFDATNGITPIRSSGRYDGGGRWSYPLHPFIDSGALTNVFYRVTGDDVLGTFLGTFVSVDGVDNNKGKQFRVWRLGRQELEQQTVGRLLLDADLTRADGNPLMAGTYTFTFFGTAEPPRGRVPPPPPPPPPPPDLQAIRQDIHEEIVRIRERLHQLEKRNSETKESARKSRWLEVRISVLTARLQYPTDEVLQQLEQAVEARKSLGRKKFWEFLDQLNTRLAELQAGG